MAAPLRLQTIREPVGAAIGELSVGLHDAKPFPGPVVRLDAMKAYASVIALALITLALVSCAKKSPATITLQKALDTQVVTNEDGSVSVVGTTIRRTNVDGSVSTFTSRVKRTTNSVPATNGLPK